MSITVNFPIDALDLDSLIAGGWTGLSLYSANGAEGPYSDTGVASNPATLQDAVTAHEAGDQYVFSFAYPTGNAAMWFKVVATDGATTSSLNDAQAFHGGGGTTLQVIRQRIGKITDTMKIGVTTGNGGADGSSAECTTAAFRRYRDDYFGGGTGVDGWIFNDLDINEWTLISDWVQATGVFSFNPEMSEQVVTGTNFEIMSRWSPEEYRDAINWAIVTAYPALSKTVIDTSTVTQEDVFEYTVPFNIKVLTNVEIESDSFTDSTDQRTFGQPWRSIAYVPLDDGLVRKVSFKREHIAGRRLRFTGTAVPNQLYNDSDYVEFVDPQIDLLVYKAAHRLYSLLANSAPTTDVDRYQAQATYFNNLYMEEIRRKASRRKPKKIWQHDAVWSDY